MILYSERLFALINVAIDGPAGAGKSTVARGAAKELGYIYVDTGALYRTVALAAQRKNVLGDVNGICDMLPGITVELKFDDEGEQRVYLNGEDVSSLIRTPEISMAASSVSQIPKVREFLLELQRSIARENNVIMDGRDIGTVVLPNADVKIFLFASPECRAERRYKELIEKGQDVKYEDVLKDVNDRDYQDSHRAAAPLRQAEDAVLVDTSELDIEQSFARLKNTILDRIG